MSEATQLTGSLKCLHTQSAWIIEAQYFTIRKFKHGCGERRLGRRGMEGDCLIYNNFNFFFPTDHVAFSITFTALPSQRRAPVFRSLPPAPCSKGNLLGRKRSRDCRKEWTKPVLLWPENSLHLTYSQLRMHRKLQSHSRLHCRRARSRRQYNAAEAHRNIQENKHTAVTAGALELFTICGFHAEDGWNCAFQFSSQKSLSYSTKVSRGRPSLSSSYPSLQAILYGFPLHCSYLKQADVQEETDLLFIFIFFKYGHPAELCAALHFCSD